ncbi:MAG: aspartate aminotransferase family protein [Candidatus Caldarchaeum sp.]
MDDFVERRSRVVASGLLLLHPITVKRASNSVVEDVEGRKYIDFTSGVGVLNLGHVHPEVTEEVEKALRDFWHVCAFVANYPGYVALVEKLVQLVPGRFEKKGILFNSGAEATENAVKIARQATKRPYVLAFENSFHGRTYLAMAMTGKYEPYKVDYEPFPAGVEHVPYPYCYRCPFGQTYPGCGFECLDYIRKFFVRTRVPANKIAGIVMEPVQGEGGFVVAPPEYIPELKKFTEENGILFIDDEVQTGFCRTGKFFAVEHFGVEPDLVVLAKALANGLPISAVVGRSSLMENMVPGSLGTTFGGNPIACAAALKVLEIMKRDNMAQRAAVLGERMKRWMDEFYEKYDIVGDVRGLGVMRAFELVKNRKTKEPAVAETSQVIEKARRSGVLLLKAGLYSNVIRFHPPLTIEPELLEKGLEQTEQALKEVVSQR